MMKNAQIITRMVKIAAVEAKQSGTVVLYLNQVRANTGYGSDITTGGGFALKHCTTQKLKLSRAGGDSARTFVVEVDGEKIPVGHEIKIKVERNRVAVPYKTANMVLFNQPSQFGPVGVDKIDEVATLGLAFGIIQRAGAWYTLPITGERVNGKEAVLKALKEDPKVCDEIRKLVLAHSAKDVYAQERTADEDHPEPEESDDD
jgi:hypothetical protein